MAGVAQLVELRIVIPVVVGSSPIVRSSLGPLAQLVEQETLNLLVEGSSPSRPTKNAYEKGTEKGTEGLNNNQLSWLVNK